MLALFPLETVVYPSESLPLHIFEKRYQELIFDCEEHGILFGIPTYINRRLEYGTEVRLKKKVNTQSNGECDVVCIGTRVFKINSFYNQLPDKLYAGGEVEYFKDDTTSDAGLQKEVQYQIEKLYTELNLDRTPVFTVPFFSYQVAHKIGLALSQEYQLLKIRKEINRLQYILGHLKTTIPIVKEMNRTRRVIEMNGHFKNFDPLDFEDFKF